MRIKKYMADTMPEALACVKKELGEDAVILQVRKTPAGRDGKLKVEVTAAIDPAPAGRPTVSQPAVVRLSSQEVETAVPWESESLQPAPLFSVPASRTGRAPQPRVEPARRPQPFTPDKVEEYPTPLSSRPSSEPSRPTAPPAAPRAFVEAQQSSPPPIGRVETSSRRISRDQDHHREAARNMPRTEHREREKPEENIETRLGEMRVMLSQLMARMSPEPETLSHPLISRLCRSGISERTAGAIMQTLEKETGRPISTEIPESLLVEAVAGRIACAPPIALRSSGPTVIALVGPTGVGKTTTVAKLAANARLLDQRSVALISADTFRVGAIHQLRTFAYIADIPLAVAYTPEELREAIYRAHNADLIFIDTVGRSPRGSAQVREIGEFIEAGEPTETHLVMSATSKESDMLDVCEKFSCMPLSRILLTKMDETSTPGAWLNVAGRIPLPLSYITVGQTVPDDIEQADAHRLARQILEGGLYGNSGRQVA